MTAQAAQIVVHSELSQDFITSDGVLVDATKTGQVAVFRNPSKPGTPAEAVVISSALGVQGGLYYLASETTSRTGWALTALTDDTGNPLLAAEVLAFATTWGSVDAYYVDTTGTMQHLWMDSTCPGGWTPPQAVGAAPPNLGQLRVAYSPGASASTGALVVYGIDPEGTVLFAWADSGSWTTRTMSINGAASSWTLTLRDESSWLLTMVASSAFTFWPDRTGAGQPVGTVKAGGSAWSWGTIGAGGLTIDGGAVDENPHDRVIYNATAMAGTTATMLLFLGDGTGASPVAWVLNPGAGDQALGTVPGTAFVDVAVVEQSDGYVDIYGIDADYDLYTLRQVAFNADAMVAGIGDTQTWGPILQLDSRIRSIVANPAPFDVPVLIAADADEGALHLHYQDPSTAMWLTAPVRLPTASQLELDRWRTEVTLYSGDGVPAAGTALTVGAGSAVDIEVNGQFFVLDSDNSVTITTNALGKATLSSQATSLAPPALSFASDGLPQQAPHSPAGTVNAYLAGNGTLPGKPALDTTAVSKLGSAQDPATALALIKQIASLGQSSGAGLGVPGVHVYTGGAGQRAHQVFASRREADAYLEAAAVGSSFWSDVWDDTKRFAGDVWQGIENGAHAVEHVVVDEAAKAVQLFVRIGDDLVQLADWVVNTVEDGLRAVTAVFKWIGAEITKVIDFLKALFDLKAIWNTKTALVGELTQLPERLKALLDGWGTDVQGFFTKQQATVDAAFDTAIGRFGGPLSALPGWAPMGQPPDATAKVAGDATASDLSQNPHANWLQDKVSSYAPSTMTVPTATISPLDRFLGDLIDAGDDLLAAFSTFGTGVSAAMKADSISSFEDIAVSTLLQATKDLVDALIEFVDGAAQGMLALGVAAMDALSALLAFELELGFVNDVYGWVAGAAGGSGTMTVADLVALLAAFPITVIYKLIAGVDEEPFPNGAPAAGLAASSTDSTLLEVFGTVGGVLTVLGGALTLASDLLDPDTPSWVTIASLGTTALHVAFTHPGFLEWDPLEWTATAVVAANLLWLGPTAYFIFGSTIATGLAGAKTAATSKLNSVLPTWVLGDVVKVGSSLFGVFCLAGAAYAAIEGAEQPALAVVSNFLEPLPGTFSFLTMTPIKDVAVLGEIALGLKVALDVVGGFLGGALEATSPWTG